MFALSTAHETDAGGDTQSMTQSDMHSDSHFGEELREERLRTYCEDKVVAVVET